MENETHYSISKNYRPFFRNDDVSYDTEPEYFEKFCKIFNERHLIQTHAITLYGLCNYANMFQGKYCVYPSHHTLSQLDNDLIRSLSRPYFFKNNAAVIDIIKNSPDEIALHGLYHTNYSMMSFSEQYADMARGLNILRKLFPEKNVIYFVPPFNKYNRGTFAAANKLGLRVLTDEGIHLEESLPALNLYPGIWYRYHHHRFYPTSKFGNPELNFDNLAICLDRAANNYCQGRLPMPSFDYEGDARFLKKLVEKYKTQDWYLNTALNRRDRLELKIAMGWIYSHLEYGDSIFEIGCGAGNNLHWLAMHGYENLGGNDIRPEALAVARDVAAANNWRWNLLEDDLLDPLHLPENCDLILAVNCVYYKKPFDLKKFLSACREHLSGKGVILMDLIDSSFNHYPFNKIHTTQWQLPPREQTKTSEYWHRIDRAGVCRVASELELKVVSAFPSFQQIPRVVYAISFKDNQCMARRMMPKLKISENMLYPAVEAIFNSGKFDAEWYCKNYGHRFSGNPLVHYVLAGAYEGCNPDSHFDCDEYRRKHMLLDDHTNPLVHSILFNRDI